MYAPVAEKKIHTVEGSLGLSSSQASQVASEEPIHRLDIEVSVTFAIRQGRSLTHRFLNAADPRCW